MDYVKGMDVIKLHNCITNLLKIERRKRAGKVYDMAISSGAGFGNKDASKKVKAIVKESNKEETKEAFKNEMNDKKPVLIGAGKPLTSEELKQIVRGAEADSKESKQQ